MTKNNDTTYNILDERVIKFIKEHHILTLATTVDNNPYCATCFYSYSKELNLFIITSDINTKHIQNILKQNKIAGTIALETNIIGKIRGIQFTANITELKDDLLSKARISYLKRFPFAALMDTLLWGIEPDFIKMTDNRLGFGKKIYWYKSPEI